MAIGPLLQTRINDAVDKSRDPIIDGILEETLAGTVFATYFVPVTGSYAAGNPFAIVLGEQRGGFGLAGNLIQVPSAGHYAVTFSANLRSSSTSAVALIDVYASPTNLAYSDIVTGDVSRYLARAGTRRFSTSPSDSIYVTLAGSGIITNPSTQKIGVYANGSGNLSLDTTTGPGQLVIRRLG
jgi:hypothetical protein